MFDLAAPCLRFRELLVDVLLALDGDVDDLQLGLADLFVGPRDARQEFTLLAGQIGLGSLQRQQSRFALVAFLVHVLDDDDLFLDQLVLAADAQQLLFGADDLLL